MLALYVECGDGGTAWGVWEDGQLLPAGPCCVPSTLSPGWAGG